MWGDKHVENKPHRASYSFKSGTCSSKFGDIHIILADLSQKLGQNHSFMANLNFGSYQAPGFDLVSVKLEGTTVEVQLFQVTVNPTNHRTLMLRRHHCAQQCNDAWWYMDCSWSQLTWQYLYGTHIKWRKGIYWHTWKCVGYSNKSAEMNIHPQHF
jgi:hypothetical protein